MTKRHPLNVHLAAMSSRPELKLDWASHEAAKYAVEHWHYSKSLPTPPLVKVGVWESGAFIGVVIFSRGANNNIGKAFGLEATGVCELTRVALSAHKTEVTRIIKIALAFLKKHCPKLRLAISYADPKQKHHGGIYQGGGWTYVGKSESSTEYVSPDGRQWHGRMVSASGHKLVYGQRRTVWRHDQCKPVQVEGKHKYLMPLDAEMRKQIFPLAKPYPKRAGSDTLDTPANHAGKGGSLPTPALHLQ